MKAYLVLVCSVTFLHIPSFYYLPSPTAGMIVLLRSLLLNDDSLWWWSIFFCHLAYVCTVLAQKKRIHLRWLIVTLLTWWRSTVVLAGITSGLLIVIGLRHDFRKKIERERRGKRSRKAKTELLSIILFSIEVYI